jgi:hypothetical protein
MDLPLGFVTWIPQRVWEAISGRRRVSLLMHCASFVATGKQCFFLNITNQSKTRDIEVTHVWIAVEPEQHALPPDRPLPKRLRPDESWETWVEADRMSQALGDKLLCLGRARLSTGQVIKSKRNKTVPSTGSIPGGPVQLPPQ